MKKTAIVVAAVGIDAKIIDVFLERFVAIGFSRKDIFVDDIPSYGVLNKPRVLNRLIKKAIGLDYDIIIQTDIDCIPLLETLEQTSLLLNSYDVVNINPVYPDVFNGDFEDRKNYVEGERTGVGYGGWNAARTKTWLRMGGFDERIYGYGFEDNAFFYRCEHVGLSFFRSCELPLLHIPHSSNRTSFKSTAELSLYHIKNRDTLDTVGQPNYLRKANKSEVKIHITTQSPNRDKLLSLLHDVEFQLIPEGIAMDDDTVFVDNGWVYKNKKTRFYLSDNRLDNRDARGLAEPIGNYFWEI